MAWTDRIMLLFTCIIDLFLIYDFFDNFFEVKVEPKVLRIFIVGTILAEYCINSFQNSFLNLIIIPLVSWSFITIVFNVKTKIRLIYFTVAYSILIGVDFLYNILSNMTLPLLIRVGFVPITENLWQALFVKFLNYIIFLMIKQKTVKLQYKISEKIFYIYLCLPISTLGIMLTVFFSGIDTEKYIVKILMTIFFILMIAGNIILFYAFQKYVEQLEQSARQQQEIIYQKAEVLRLTKIAEMNENYNMLIHNISHNLKVIGELAYEKKSNEIYQLVSKLTGGLKREKIYEYSSNKMLNLILSEYERKAENEKITFQAYVEPGCKLSQIEDDDLITIIGNLLDNAFRATRGQDKSKISVHIFMEREGKLCIIKVVNDFSGQLNEVKGKLYTTKKEKEIHGIGLASVQKIAEGYGGYFDYYVEENKFFAIVMIPIEK